MAPLLCEVYKLVLFKGKRRIILVCLFNTAIIGSLQLLIVLSRKIPLSDKVYIIYKAKPQYIIVWALEFFKSFNIKKRNKIGDRGEPWGMPVCV